MLISIIVLPRLIPRQTKKPFLPNHWDERQTFRGTTRIRTSYALSSGNGGTPSCSHRPLPGEPSDTHQGGFQPVTASLWDGQTRYFPVQRIYQHRIVYITFYFVLQGEKQIFLQTEVVNCSLCYKGDIPRPDAGYFALSGKVTKTPLKPLRFQPSRLVLSVICCSTIGTPFRKRESFAPLTRYMA